MTYRIQLEPERNLVRVEFTGDWEFSLVAIMLDATVETCRRERTAKVLLDTTKAKGILSTVDQLELAISMATPSKPAIAFSVLCTPEQAASQSCLETFAVNRGGKVRVVTDVEEALRWLAAAPEDLKPGRLVG